MPRGLGHIQLEILNRSTGLELRRGAWKWGVHLGVINVELLKATGTVESLRGL